MQPVKLKLRRQLKPVTVRLVPCTHETRSESAQASQFPPVAAQPLEDSCRTCLTYRLVRPAHHCIRHSSRQACTEGFAIHVSAGYGTTILEQDSPGPAGS